jgi:hypothetical protein
LIWTARNVQGFLPFKVSNSKKLTYPYEYAAVLNGPDGEKPVIVGRQAVNLWAAVYSATEKQPAMRHDEDHLKILGRCAPEYLREIAGEALAGRLGVGIVESTLRRLFKTMQTPADAGALWHAELSPDMLAPMECLRSPVPSISELCRKEMPAAKEAFKADNYRPKYRTQPNQAPMLTRSGRRKPRTTQHYNTLSQ